MKRICVRIALAALSLTAAQTASAHAGHQAGDTGLLAGLLHPLTGIDHLLALLAIGLWIGLPARRLPHERTWMPLLLLSAFALGIAWGWSATMPSRLEAAVAFSVLAVGLLLAASQRLHRGLSAALLCAFALLHGSAHGSDWHGAGQPFALAGGALAATALLLAAGIGLGHALRDCGAWLRRATAAGLAAAGLLLMAGAA